MVLKMLEKDGIRRESLPHENLKHGDVPHALVKEYDKTNAGYITMKEFMVLGDLILKQYEEGNTRKKERRIGKYELLHKLGFGAESVVRVGIDRETGERKAIKIIPRGNCSDLSRVDTEIKAMIMLDHPNIVSLEEVLENDDYIFFVMEVCGGGSLANYVQMRALSEPSARFYVPQLLKGLRYCHRQGVCHRDLKLENLLLHNDGQLKIADFGHAGIFQKGWDMFSTGLVGSLHHLAPEQIQGHAYRGEKLDIWGVGIILYRLLTGKPPFLADTPQAFMKAIVDADITIPARLSDNAKDLIRMILQADPENRPSIKKILKHPWFDAEVKKKRLAVYILQFPRKVRFRLCLL